MSVEEVIAKYPCKELSIEITERCDQRCIHCSSEATEKGWENELTTNEIKMLIRKAKEFLGTEVISLSGGDPILHKDFVNIVEFIDEMKLNVLIYSSGGLFLDELSRKLEVDLAPFTFIKELFKIIPIMKKPGNKMIYSLEGGNKFTHEFITRRSGSWACTEKSILETVAMKIYTEVHTCPMTVNMFELIKMYDMLRGWGVNRWSFLRLVPQGRCSEVNYLITDNDEFYSLAGILASLKIRSKEDDKMEIRIGDPLNFFDCMAEYKDAVMPMTSCSAGKNRMLIRADGSAQFCAALKHSPSHDFGNVRKTDIVDLWCNSDMVKKLREFHEFKYKDINSECSVCRYLEICKGGCLSQRIAIYGSMYEGSDPLCPIMRHSDIDTLPLNCHSDWTKIYSEEKDDNRNSGNCRK